MLRESTPFFTSSYGEIGRPWLIVDECGSCAHYQVRCIAWWANSCAFAKSGDDYDDHGPTASRVARFDSATQEAVPDDEEV